MNIVAGNVVEVVLGEIKLRRPHLLAMSGLPRGIQIGGKVVDRIIGGELHAADQAIAVIERRENDRRAELSLVDQMLRRGYAVEGLQHRSPRIAALK